MAAVSPLVGGAGGARCDLEQLQALAGASPVFAASLGASLGGASRHVAAAMVAAAARAAPATPSADDEEIRAEVATRVGMSLPAMEAKVRGQPASGATRALRNCAWHVGFGAGAAALPTTGAQAKRLQRGGAPPRLMQAAWGKTEKVAEEAEPPQKVLAQPYGQEKSVCESPAIDDHPAEEQCTFYVKKDVKYITQEADTQPVVIDVLEVCEPDFAFAKAEGDEAEAQNEYEEIYQEVAVTKALKDDHPAEQHKEETRDLPDGSTITEDSELRLPEMLDQPSGDDEQEQAAYRAYREARCKLASARRRTMCLAKEEGALRDKLAAKNRERAEQGKYLAKTDDEYRDAVLGLQTPPQPGGCAQSCIRALPEDAIVTGG